VADPAPTPGNLRAMGGTLAQADAPKPMTPAFTPIAPQGVSAPAYAPTYTPVGKPVASPMRVAYDKPRAEKRVAKPVKRRVEEAREEAPRAPTGTHLIQLGAFTTSVNAERARKLFLAKRSAVGNHDITITKAVVNGRDFWRVAAGGFDQASASGACGRVKKHGGACFAYQNGHLPAGQALAMAAPVSAPGRKR
jgi:cell division protein FtsN